MSKNIIGSFRLVHRPGKGYWIETSSNLDKCTKHVFLSMLFAQLAHDEGISQRQYAEMLLDLNKVYPATFKEEI
ncbi:hypothetical protein [Enterococcus sp. DIV1444a]|uniref:hypothetical protein n=1 Tax=Enterococcus sp. DIV1444a TaxID=2774679 RepID=UPI003F278369